MMNYFSALHKCDLEIRFHQRDLYQTSAFCGHVFTMKPLPKKIYTWTHDRKQMWLPDAHLRYFILSAARPCVAVLLHGAATSSAISPQMHQQNPADAPPESRGTTRIWRTPTESCLHLQRVCYFKFVHHFVAIGDFKNELRSGNAQFGSNSMIFRAVWPWNLTDDLEKQ